MSEFDNRVIFALLLSLLSLVLCVGIMMVFLVISWRRRLRLPSEKLSPDHEHLVLPDRPSFSGVFTNRPICWLAIKSRNPLAVQTALGLNNPQPCTWTDGLAQAEDYRLFISPPVNGWILVMGSGLPEPAEDVDTCFRFLQDLSRKLGEVQFFQANRVVSHHAWALADSGAIIRAYAWAGRTLWNQGPLTRAERMLDLACYEYFEPIERERGSFGVPEAIASNVEKVSRLAACWSVDPARIDERSLERRLGITGEPFRAI